MLDRSCGPTFLSVETGRCATGTEDARQSHGRLRAEFSGRLPARCLPLQRQVPLDSRSRAGSWRRVWPKRWFEADRAGGCAAPIVLARRTLGLWKLFSLEILAGNTYGWKGHVAGSGPGCLRGHLRSRPRPARAPKRVWRERLGFGCGGGLEANWSRPSECGWHVLAVSLVEDGSVEFDFRSRSRLSGRLWGGSGQEYSEQSGPHAGRGLAESAPPRASGTWQRRCL